jgi:hypothetical protein
MAKRFTDTEIWDKEWFMNLEPKLKCLVSYVRDKCDLAGIWNPNWVLASVYINDKVSENDLLKIDNGNQFVKLNNGKIHVIGFVQFQNGEKLNPASPVHKKILSLLEKNGIDYNNISNTLSNRVFNTLQVEVGVIVEDKVGVIVEDKVGVIVEDKVGVGELEKNKKYDRQKRIPETTFQKFTETWFDWHKSEFGFEPRFGGMEGRKIKSIISYFEKILNSNDSDLLSEKFKIVLGKIKDDDYLYKNCNLALIESSISKLILLTTQKSADSKLQKNYNAAMEAMELLKSKTNGHEVGILARG